MTFLFLIVLFSFTVAQYSIVGVFEVTENNGVNGPTDFFVHAYARFVPITSDKLQLYPYNFEPSELADFKESSVAVMTDHSYVLIETTKDTITLKGTKANCIVLAKTECEYPCVWEKINNNNPNESACRNPSYQCSDYIDELPCENSPFGCEWEVDKCVVVLVTDDGDDGEGEGDGDNKKTDGDGKRTIHEVKKTDVEEKEEETKRAGAVSSINRTVSTHSHLHTNALHREVDPDVLFECEWLTSTNTNTNTDTGNTNTNTNTANTNAYAVALKCTISPTSDGNFIVLTKVNLDTPDSMCCVVISTVLLVLIGLLALL